MVAVVAQGGAAALAVMDDVVLALTAVVLVGERPQHRRGHVRLSGRRNEFQLHLQAGKMFKRETRFKLRRPRLSKPAITVRLIYISLTFGLLEVWKGSSLP